ncbi:surface-adhesin E family protein [Pseudorhodoferax sp. Leaf274]|uniref:surface-adhesin E family protein n=1 Tax=Pseudorhodoferax sp. Leaf274 TaxID=1736318 RepID=UPI0007026570|nr:surface-adhesin E family protein [Pseudorhodoferax sp. Leaf274]KQP37132.1 hypothetical protein ASF44_15630 [Pseudorhodoferax sp. Leaf274]
MAFSFALHRLPCIAALALAAAQPSAHGQQTWFTLVGNPVAAETDTIELDPVTVTVDGPIRLMAIRVNRSAERVSRDGVRFRSFSGLVQFDCSTRMARFVQSSFFALPLWQGPSVELRYGPDQVRPMAFRGFEPNPSERVIRAACRSYAE